MAWCITFFFFKYLSICNFEWSDEAISISNEKILLYLANVDQTKSILQHYHYIVPIST